MPYIVIEPEVIIEFLSDLINYKTLFMLDDN